MKKNLLYDLIIFMGIALLFSFFLFDEWSYTRITKEDLRTITVQYQKHEVARAWIGIYCSDEVWYEIRQTLLDADECKKLKKGDTLVLGVKKRKVIELTVNGEQWMTLEGCHRFYKKQLKTSLIVFCGILMPLTAFVLLLKELWMKKQQEKNKKTECGTKK